MHEFHLPDMSCGHCVAAITEAAKALDPQAKLAFEREQRRVRIETVQPRERLQEALAAAGYPEA
ncbi:MAG TPA: heavy-metal-associated domain-containing protein [Burkholderiaceae bacterium]